mmetsp:Transcript_112828/g.183865  ORF Transcript_112828/g.183865 Transcript_112828/m.183865 type:complete len:92 (+) Transcript_112828:94-369(+)
MLLAQLSSGAHLDSWTYFAPGFVSVALPYHAAAPSRTWCVLAKAEASQRSHRNPLNFLNTSLCDQILPSGGWSDTARSITICVIDDQNVTC